MPTAYHMVHYRHFEVDQGDLGGRSLEALCRDALNRTDASGATLWQRLPDRIFQLDDGFQGKVLLNKVADLNDAVFGELCLVETHGLQALLDLRSEQRQLSDVTVAEIYALDEREAPAGSEFIRGLLYWLSIGDHVFFVKTQSMTADRLHAYFDWLLKQGTMQAEVVWRLQATLDKAAGGGDVGDITRLRISGRTMAPAGDVKVRAKPAAPGVDGQREVETRRTIAQGAYVSDQAVEVAKAIFGPAETASLQATLGPGEYLVADASVGVRGKRTAESRRKMRELVNNVADESDAKVQVEGKDGKITDGDAILRTRMPFDVAHPGSTLMDFENVADQLQLVYERWVQDDKISA